MLTNKKTISNATPWLLIIGLGIVLFYVFTKIKALLSDPNQAQKEADKSIEEAVSKEHTKSVIADDNHLKKPQVYYLELSNKLKTFLISFQAVYSPFATSTWKELFKQMDGLNASELSKVVHYFGTINYNSPFWDPRKSGYYWLYDFATPLMNSEEKADWKALFNRSGYTNII